MIDMRNLHSDIDYSAVLVNFNNQKSCNDCDYNHWSIFKDVHLKISKNRCPICECNLDGSLQRPSNAGQTSITPTIDHYRPKDTNLYPLLKCDDKNYLLMCKDCNEAYKGNQFPLHNSGDIRDITSTTTDLITTEKPLIVNPIYDELLELFILVFRLTPSGKKVLELEPKESTGYLYEKAKETIRIFSLGNCEIDVHTNINVQNCRIELLHDHFNKFIKFAELFLNEEFSNAIMNRDGITIHNNNYYREVFSDMKAKKLNKYGFFNFITEKQYKILVP